MTVLRETTNARGDVLLTAAAGSDDPAEGQEPVTVPLVVGDSGQFSQVMLLDTSGEHAEGTIAFFDAQGQRHALGMPDDRVGYSLSPRASMVISSEGSAGDDAAGYAVVTPTAGSGTRRTWPTPRLGARR